MYAENHKSTGKTPKEGLNSGYIHCVHGLEDSNSKDVNPPQMYRFNAIPVQNPLKICRYRLAYSKIYTERHYPRITKIILKK